MYAMIMNMHPYKGRFRIYEMGWTSNSGQGGMKTFGRVAKGRAKTFGRIAKGGNNLRCVAMGVGNF